MSMRKWMFAALAALSLVFLGCSEASDGSKDEPPVEGDKTYIEFQNPEQFPVRIYKDPSRITLFTEVPAGGMKKVEAEPNSNGIAFYPVFLLEIEGIRIDQNGAAVTVRVDEKKVNRANIPALTVIETGFAYIKIENASAYPLTFNKGNNELAPLDAASSIIMPNEIAAYQIEPETVGPYKVMKNGNVPLDLPAAVITLGEFYRDTIYFFRYDGNTLAMSRDSPLNTFRAAIWAVNSDATFIQAVSGINASTAASHFIVLTENVTASGVTFATNANKTITIRGDANLRSIANSGGSVLFTVPAGIALRLENNIKINGNGEEYNVVHVNGGAFEMNDGSVISGANTSAVEVVNGGTFTMSGGEVSGNLGGGVYVNGGTFTMSGGEVSGNTSSVGGGMRMYTGTFTMSGGEVSGNTASSGGGVFMDSGTFTMSGGEISGNTASYASGGGVNVYDGTFTKNGGGTISDTNSASKKGKVAYVFPSQERNITAGPNDNLDSRRSGAAGGWE